MANRNSLPDDFGSDTLNDFGSLGGDDFITIPWPHSGSTPIISGISDRSKYKKDLDILSRGGNFDIENPIDAQDLETFQTANENDELGDFLGKVDIEQTRTFLTGSYDMHKLLGIETMVVQGDEWLPYTAEEWDGKNLSFSADTSVGELYIANNANDELRNSCVLELNLGDIDFGVVRDSSGNGNKGILIGDFSLTKTSKLVPAMRDSFMEIPEKDIKDKVL